MNREVEAIKETIRGSSQICEGCMKEKYKKRFEWVSPEEPQNSCNSYILGPLEVTSVGGHKYFTFTHDFRRKT